MAGFAALAIAFPPLFTYLGALVLGLERFQVRRTFGVAFALGGAIWLAVLKLSSPVLPPEKFHLASITGDAIYRWQSKPLAHHFCDACECGTFSDSPAFDPEGSWDKTTRRISANALLPDNADAAVARVVVTDGKNLCQQPVVVMNVEFGQEWLTLF